MNLNELSKTMAFNSTERMPVLFVGHGNPMNAIEENEFVSGWRTVAKGIPKPNAILCISAHWETRGTFITAMERPATIHDFGGFPQELFEVQYPAAGSPELAEEVREIVQKTKIEPDERWGLDHGSWSVIKRFYPEADVPVIQMSIDYYKTPQQHYELGQELTSLRSKGVLIIGSGNIVHNLRKIAWDKFNERYGYDWAIEANEKMKQFILDGSHKELINFQSQGNAFKLAIPTPEHFLPLLYALALKEKNEQITLFNDDYVAGSLSMTSVKIS